MQLCPQRIFHNLPYFLQRFVQSDFMWQTCWHQSMDQQSHGGGGWVFEWIPCLKFTHRWCGLQKPLKGNIPLNWPLQDLLSPIMFCWVEEAAASRKKGGRADLSGREISLLLLHCLWKTTISREKKGKISDFSTTTSWTSPNELVQQPGRLGKVCGVCNTTNQHESLFS